MGGGMWSGLNSSLLGNDPRAARERSRTLSAAAEGGWTADEDGGMPRAGLLEDFTLVI